MAAGSLTAALVRVLPRMESAGEVMAIFILTHAQVKDEV